MGEHRTFRSDNTSVSTDKLSAGTALSRTDSRIRVSREAQEEASSLTERAFRVGSNGRGDPRSGTARYRSVRTGLPKQELFSMIKVVN